LIDENDRVLNKRSSIVSRGSEMAVAHWYSHLMITEPDAYLIEKHYSNDAIHTRDAELAGVCVHFDSSGAVFDLAMLRKIAPNCLFHIVDTSAFNPAGYKIVQWDRRATLDKGRDYTNTHFGEYPVKVYRENMEQQVCTAWAMRTRRYSEVKWSRDGGDTRRFNRLIVPLGREPITGNLGQVLVSTHPQPLDITA
jgi:hypothetical protein